MGRNVIFCVSLFLVSLSTWQGVHSSQQAECVRGKYPPKAGSSVPSYVVNLDLPPKERWASIVKDKGPAIKHLLDTVINLLRNFGPVADKLIEFVDKDLGFLADTFPYPYGEEMKGIASASGLPLGEIVLYNVFYEVFTVCTSIIAEDPSGKLFHARNLDFGLFLGWNSKNHTWLVTDALRPLIMNVDFKQGGKLVFRTVNYAGYVGILTGIKPGTFTLTMNERFNINGGYIGILKWLLGSRDIQWMSFLTRNTFINATSYAEAKNMLANTPMLAPAYFILGGNQSGQGCIITRDRDRAVDIWNLGEKNSTWYLLETNYDNWEKPFFLDDRRTPGNECMRKLTQQNVAFAGIFDVLSSKPVLNKLTTYTALMQVNSGSLETYLQYCLSPCDPW